MNVVGMDKRAGFSILIELLGTFLGTSFIEGRTLYVFIALSVITFLLIIIIGRMDPGTLSRRNSNYYSSVLFKDYTYRVIQDNKSIAGRSFEKKGVQLHSEVFCKTCGIFRPSGTSHCRECDQCIAVMDHHCVWLSNCIGEVNYPYFMNLLSIECLRGLILVVYRCMQPFPEFSFTQKSICFYVTLLWSFMLTLFISALFGYFMWLNLKGYTSRAYCKPKKVQCKD
ncbi:hypothetical protein NEIRO03_1516 [Nematocida sp. AWRm78]|nr:hypothetical protein NEIRO03_1516 [Nematocida sp. AWRm78]